MKLEKRSALERPISPTKNTSNIKKLVGLLVVIILGGLVAWGIASKEEIVFGSTVDTPDNNLGVDVGKGRREPVLGWSYDEKLDRAGQAKVFIARLDSKTRIRQGWPYDSETYLTVGLTGFKDQGSGVSIELSSGEFNCGLEECSMMIGFNGKPPSKYRLLGAGSGDASIKFLSLPRDQFVSEIKQADSMVVSTDLIGYGKAEFEFDTKGLSWIY